MVEAGESTLALLAEPSEGDDISVVPFVPVMLDELSSLSETTADGAWVVGVAAPESGGVSVLFDGA